MEKKTLKREEAFGRSCGTKGSCVQLELPGFDDYEKMLLQLEFTEDELKKLNKVFNLIEKHGSMEKCYEAVQEYQDACEEKLNKGYTMLKANSDLLEKYENDFKNAVIRTEEVFDLWVWFSNIGLSPIDFEAVD